MDKDLEKLIEVFSLSKRAGFSNENAADAVYYFFKHEEMEISLDDFHKMPYEMAINLIPIFIDEYDKNRNARNVILTFRLSIIKDELIAKQTKESGVKYKTNNKDNNQENKERECIVFPSYSKLLRSIFKDSPLSSISGVMESNPPRSVYPHIYKFPIGSSFLKPFVFYKVLDESPEEHKTNANDIKDKSGEDKNRSEESIDEVLERAIEIYNKWVKANFTESIAISQAYKYIKSDNVKLKRSDYMSLPYEMAMGLIDCFIKDCRLINPVFTENKELRRLIWDKSYIKMDHDYTCKPKNKKHLPDSNKEPETKDLKPKSPFKSAYEESSHDLMNDTRNLLRFAEMHKLLPKDFFSVSDINCSRVGFFDNANRRCNSYIPIDYSFPKLSKEDLLKLKEIISDKSKNTIESDDSISDSMSKYLLAVGIVFKADPSPVHASSLILNPYLVLKDFDIASLLLRGVKITEDKPKEDKPEEEVAKDTQTSTKNETILEEATRILGGDRQADYGDPVRNFINIAKEVNRWAGTELSPLDCVNVHIATKTCREQFRHKRDNQVDLVAYQEIKRRIIDWCDTHDWKTE